MPRLLRLCLPALLLASLLPAGGCGRSEPPRDYLARVGDAYLTEADLAAALEGLNPGEDSSYVRQQIIEQWITNELLYQEARRRGLADDEEVRRLLQENERSVLISALLARLYDEAPAEPSPEEIQAYFERNKEQLRLREPFVQVYYLFTPAEDSARTARSRMQQALSAGTLEAEWPALAARFSADAALSLELAATLYPEARLFSVSPAVLERLQRMREGELSPVLATDEAYHVVYLARRVPAGTIPELAWVEDEVRQRLVIQTRKQMYARQVQRLRNEAMARESLDLR
ncbi:hypothetical protein AWN76_002785 [Rhodothermaceae bacterium RA]|nr:hypothetical protein AWN76_002785 [Rhodothermaceae bacterium RA]